MPGVYHQRVGALQVTALFDGVVALGRQEVVDVPPTLVSRLLEGRYVPEDKKGLQTAINAFLIRQGNHLTLVDTGTAQCLAPAWARCWAICAPPASTRPRWMRCC